MASEVAPTLWVRKASGLTREIGGWSALAVTMCYAIGGGAHRLVWFSTYWYPGCDPVLSSVITSIAALILMFIYAWMLITMPRTGGDYIYISRVVNPFVGFMSSFGYMISAGLCNGILSFFALESFGSAISVYGLWTNNPGISALGALLGKDPMVKILLSLIFITLFGVIAFLGLRAHMIAVWIMFIIPVIFVIPMWIGYATNTPATTAVLWDKFIGAGTYEKISSEATRLGFDEAKFGTFSLNATLLATVSPAWAWVGTWQAAPSAGGEIKTVRSSAWIGVGLSGILVALYYCLLPYFGFNAYGKMFVAKYIWMYQTHFADLSKIIPYPPFPHAGFFASPLWAGNPVIALMPPIGVAFWQLNFLPTGYLICSRYIFSWSFDRFFPERFAAVNERFHSPHNAVLLTWVISLLGIYGCWALEAGAAGAGFAALDTTWLWWWSSIPVCWAALVLPYTRKDLYESGFKLDIAGIPLITILGLFGILLSTYIFMLAVAAVPPYPDTFTLLFTWFFAGLIFLGLYAYNVRRGVDVKSIYAEVPPA